MQVDDGVTRRNSADSVTGVGHRSAESTGHTPECVVVSLDLVLRLHFCVCTILVLLCNCFTDKRGHVGGGVCAFVAFVTRHKGIS